MVASYALSCNTYDILINLRYATTVVTSAVIDKVQNECC